MGLMRWVNGTLYLKPMDESPWAPYTSYSHLTVPDYKIPGGSPGWATYQKLLKQGWKIVT